MSQVIAVRVVPNGQARHSALTVRGGIVQPVSLPRRAKSAPLTHVVEVTADGRVAMSYEVLEGEGRVEGDRWFQRVAGYKRAKLTAGQRAAVVAQAAGMSGREGFTLASV